MAETIECKECKQKFVPVTDAQVFCSDQCKQEALANLDKDSDECLSCQ